MSELTLEMKMEWQGKFSEWARDNPHNVMTSFPRSGRGYLTRLIRKLSGRYCVNGLVNMPEDACFSDILLYVKHDGSWEILGDKGRYILLLRDPRDSLLSKAYNNYRSENTTPEKLLCDDGWLLPNIRDWRNYVEKYTQYEPLIVQYEKLCLYPYETLTKIFCYLEIEMIDDIMSVIPGEDVIKTNPMISREQVPAVFQTNYDRYLQHSLKWQRSGIVAEGFLYTIWYELEYIMLKYGYTKEGHSEVLLNDA